MLAGYGLDFGAGDWGMILNLALTAFAGYLAKNFISDENGKAFGRSANSSRLGSS
jgi:hypothetical protein